MILPSRRHSATYPTALFFGTGVMIAGCTSSPVDTVQTLQPKPKHAKQAPTPSIRSPQLRIINQGSTALKKLTVRFPEDQITFGDIPAGATTGYKSVPHGVFGYAAYSLVVKGKNIIVPVTDWVGEKPMSGKAFTYTIKFFPKRSRIVELVKVTKDK